MGLYNTWEWEKGVGEGGGGKVGRVEGGERRGGEGWG